jgi:hypothetical protein
LLVRLVLVLVLVLAPRTVTVHSLLSAGQNHARQRELAKQHALW